MSKIIKIQNCRNSNFIPSELISNENQPQGIEAHWFDNEVLGAKENTPENGEICSIRIEGNYEIDITQNLWIQFETWDSNQNGISNKDHVETNRLVYGQIKTIERQEKSFIDCKFQVNKTVDLNHIQTINPIEKRWKDVFIGFAKSDFSGSLLTVIKFDKYYSAICQTDGGPFYRFIFEISKNIQLIHILECDKYEDSIIRYTNQVIDEELEILLKNEAGRRIKAFKYMESNFNEFLFYVDEENMENLKAEINRGNKIILRKGWKKGKINEIEEIEIELNKMKDYH